MLKSDEVMFTGLNRQIEQHIGVSYLPLIHTHARTLKFIGTHLLPSLVAMTPLSVTSCVYLWVYASDINVCSVCPISPSCFRCDRKGRRGNRGEASPPTHPGLERRSAYYLSRREDPEIKGHVVKDMSKYLGGKTHNMMPDCAVKHSFSAGEKAFSPLHVLALHQTNFNVAQKSVLNYFEGCGEKAIPTSVELL